MEDGKPSRLAIRPPGGPPLARIPPGTHPGRGLESYALAFHGRSSLTRRTLPDRPLRLCVVGYSQLSELVRQVMHEFDAEIEVVDAEFGAAAEVVREREASGLVDAFVSAGSSAAMLRQALSAPIATIKVGGYDLLVALRKARQISRKVGIVTYGETIAELDAVKGLLDAEIVQRAYRTWEDAQHHFMALAEEGCRVVIGSSIIVELAQQHGLHGILVYSAAAVRQGLQDGLELARAARHEADRYAQLDGVLHNLQEPVLAVDRQGRVMALNPPMEDVLQLPRQVLMHRPLDEVAPEISLSDTLRNAQEDRRTVCVLHRREWLMNRTLMREDGQVVGALVTLYDAAKIQEADSTLRSDRVSRQHPAARWRFDDLLGASPAFVAARTAAERYARTDKTILITGESGTGKELFAQAIHNAGRRQGRPFVAVNCAAVPEALLESELFGHEEGAFTGSRKGGKRGLIEIAHTGTLFLDEIGDMPVALQTRLLRVLQEREVMRVGGSMPIPVDLRVIAATHQPLEDLIPAMRFRADLYYRLNILRLKLPRLRERSEDIEALASSLLARSLRGLGSRLGAAALLQPLLPTLRAYPWPGNVRELENICERIAVFFAHNPDARSYTDMHLDCPELFRHAEARTEEPSAEDLERLLEQCNGSRKDLARLLGVSRSTLWRRMQGTGRD